MTTSDERRSERRALLLRLINRFGETVLWRWVLRLLEIEFLDRSTAIAAKAFVAVIPLVALTIVLLPSGVDNSWFESRASALGVTSGELASFDSLQIDSVVLGILGLLLLVFYATSFGTSIQRLYRRAWRRPASAEASRWKVLQWLAVFILYSVVVALLQASLTQAGSKYAATLVAFVGGVGLWTWSGRILLGREVRWRALWFGGLLSQLGLGFYTQATLVWLPQSLGSNEGAGGAYVAAVTLLSWLIGSAFTLVVVTALPPVLTEKGNLLTRVLSCSEPLEPGAAPSLPPPTASPLSLWWSGAPEEG